MNLTLIKREIRKRKDILATGGYAVVILVIWDFIKNIILLNWNIPINIDDPDLYLYVSIFSITSIVEFIYCIVSGFYLISLSRSNKKINILALILSIILCIFSFGLLTSNITNAILSQEFDIISGFLLVEDVIFIYFTLRIFISIIMIIKYTKTIKEQNNEC